MDNETNGSVLTFGPYRLRVNVERTRAWYRAQTPAWCTCAGCRNMERAFRVLPSEVAALFGALGVNPMNPGETAHYAGKRLSPERSEVFSSAWYHLCGELLDGGDCLPTVTPDGVISGTVDGYGEEWPLCEGWSVTFKKECDLLPESFPRPCFQMELWCTLPWLLDEPNIYM